MSPSESNESGDQRDSPNRPERDAESDPAGRQSARTDGETRAGRGQSNHRTTQPDTDPHHALLVDCIENPDRGVERLPYVLNLLESEDARTRLLAAMTSCLVAVEADDEEMVEYLVRRMSDRLSDDQLTLELTTALDYLTSRYSEAVEELLAEIADEMDEEVPLPEVGSFTRNYYYGQEFKREGIGRRQIAGKDSDNPRHTVADREREEREQRDPSRGTGTEEAEKASGDPLASESEEIPDETVDPGTIADRSRFDELHIEGRHYSGRYASVYEALVGRRGDERAVALRLLGRPVGVDELRAFDEEVAEHLGNWAAVSGHDNIVRIYDWGINPQSWLATSFTEGTVADLERIDFSTALEMSISLASAVAHTHQHDVVHGAIDPRNVVFPGGTFERPGPEHVPLLDNVGLIHSYSNRFKSDEFLDPRYKAPEHYSDQFGRVDHSTDIYQLGATLYRLFTGRPPYTGGFKRVRNGVLENEPPTASTVVSDLPEQLDQPLTKAMAKQKMRRYETVEHLLQELRSISPSVVED